MVMFRNKKLSQYLFICITVSLFWMVGCKSTDDDDETATATIPSTCTGVSTTTVDTSSSVFGAPPNLGIGVYKYDETSKLLYGTGTIMGSGAFSLKFEVKTLNTTTLILTDSDSTTDYTYTRATGSYPTGADISGSWDTAAGGSLLLLKFNNKFVSFTAGSKYYAANGTYTYSDDKITLTLATSGFGASATKDDDGEITTSLKTEGSTETLTLTTTGGTATDFTRQDLYTPGCGIIGTWKNGTMTAWYYEFFSDGTYRVYSSADS